MRRQEDKDRLLLTKLNDNTSTESELEESVSPVTNWRTEAEQMKKTLFKHPLMEGDPIQKRPAKRAALNEDKFSKEFIEQCETMKSGMVKKRQGKAKSKLEAQLKQIKSLCLPKI